MLLRAQLAEALRSWMGREELTQAQAAKRLGITQPRMSEIVRGKVELLSLDYLAGLCAKAGLDIGLRLAALDDPSAQFGGLLLARMQAPRAHGGMAAAFNASPGRLGRAALKAAAMGRIPEWVKPMATAPLKPRSREKVLCSAARLAHDVKMKS